MSAILHVMLGTYVLSSGYYDEYYKKACLIRDKVKADFEKAFEKCDIILAPVSPVTAWELKGSESPKLSAEEVYLSDIFTVPVNLAGLPAVSVPAGSIDGLPAGVQLIGRNNAEQVLLSAAEEFENCERQ